MRPCQRCTNSAVNSRMKPPRQIRSTRLSSSAACNAVSKPARSLPNGLLSMTRVGIRLSRAFARPGASALFEITTTISAGKPFALAASISAVIFDPRPEIRIATRRLIASPCQVEMAVINHAVFTFGGNDFAQQNNAFAAFAENFGDRLDGVGFDDRDHPDAAIEGAQQFEFGDASLRREPFEHREYRQPGQIDADAEMF